MIYTLPEHGTTRSRISTARTYILRALLVRQLINQPPVSTSPDRAAKAHSIIAMHLWLAKQYLHLEEVFAGIIFERHGCTFGAGAKNLQGSKYREWIEFPKALGEYISLDLPRILGGKDER